VDRNFNFCPNKSSGFLTAVFYLKKVNKIKTNEHDSVIIRFEKYTKFTIWLAIAWSVYNSVLLYDEFDVVIFIKIICSLGDVLHPFLKMMYSFSDSLLLVVNFNLMNFTFLGSP